MRVNIFSGPGAGSSTVALWLTSELRKCGIETEYVDEWIKRWAYEKRKLSGWDQWTVFNNQLEKEEFYLKNGIPCIVSDAPLLMQLAYMKKYGNERFLSLCVETIKLFEEDYRSVNILLNRGKLSYNSLGRWQTYEEALEMDRLIKEILEAHANDFTEIDTTDWNKILRETLSQIRCSRC